MPINSLHAHPQLETAELKVQLLKNQQALSDAEMGSMKEAEAAEELMQQTSARLDKVQNAYAQAQDKAQKLALHSKSLQNELKEKASALAAAQAAQELALSRVRSLEADRMYLKQLIGESHRETAVAGDLVHALEASQRERQEENAEANRLCAEMKERVSALEAQLQAKDHLLQSMQSQLQESASSHKSIAADIMQHLAPAKASDAVSRPKEMPPPAAVDASSFSTFEDFAAGEGSSGTVEDNYLCSIPVTCDAVFGSPKFSPVADPIASPRWVTLLEDNLEQPQLDLPSTRAGNLNDNELAAKKELNSRMEQQGDRTAIVASDSPIKGIIFSRTITDADFQPSPRGSESPRKLSSPRRTVARKTVAEVKAELGFLEQPSAGSKGPVHVTSAEEAVLGCKSWDVTISSLTPRSVHDTQDSSSWSTPRVIAPTTLLSRRVE